MLAGVSGQDHPAAQPVRQGEDAAHVARAEQPGFVDPQNLSLETLLEHFVSEKVFHGIGIREALLPQHAPRGIRRGCEGIDLAPLQRSISGTAACISRVLPVPAPPRMSMTRSHESRTCLTAASWSGFSPSER